MFLKFFFLSRNFLFEPDLSSWLAFIGVLLELEKNRNGDIVFALACLGDHVLLVNQLLFKWSLKALLLSFKIFIFNKWVLFTTFDTFLVCRTCKVAIVKDHLFIFSQLATSGKERQELLPVNCNWFVSSIYPEQNLVKRFPLSIKWLSNYIVNTTFKIVVLDYSHQKVFTVNLILTLSALFFRLHKASSKVFYPLTWQVYVCFLFNILEGVLFNHRKYALHTLLRLFFSLVLN